MEAERDSLGKEDAPDGAGFDVLGVQDDDLRPVLALVVDEADEIPVVFFLGVGARGKRGLRATASFAEPVALGGLLLEVVLEEPVEQQGVFGGHVDIVAVAGLATHLAEPQRRKLGVGVVERTLRRLTGLQVEPSPFSIERDGATRIRYTLDDVPNLVRVRIFDARGRKVRTLEDARLAGRTGELVWNGRDDDGNRVRVGVYIVLFEAVRTNDGTIARFKTPVVVARPLN